MNVNNAPGNAAPSSSATETFTQKAGAAVGKLLPKNYDVKKAVLASVITLIVFIIGVLCGTYLPWWIAVLLGAAIVFGGFVGMAQFDHAFACSKTMQKKMF